MSTWGGIGEGIAQGLSDRMAREDKMRRERQAQANADRAFQFQQEQANRAQANADRQYEANRADAENAQANAERQMEQGERRLDLYQQNSDREYGLKQDELALKGAAQEWESALNDEKLRGLQIANEKLDIELRKKKREEEIQQNTGADQFVLATSRMLDGTLGNKGKWQFGTDDGKQQDLEGTLVEGDGFYQIFGKDSPLVKQGFYGIFMQDDENGEPNFVFLNSNPRANIVKTPEQMYEMYKGQYNEGLANRYFGKTAQRKELGMLREQENIKADAKVRVQKQAQDAMLDRKQMDVFSRQRSYEYRLAAAGEIDQTELDKRLDAIDAREQRMLEKGGGSGTGTGNPSPTRDPSKVRAIQDAMKQKQASRVTVPVAEKTVPVAEREGVTPVDHRPTQKKSVVPKSGKGPELRRKQAEERKVDDAERAANNGMSNADVDEYNKLEEEMESIGISFDNASSRFKTLNDSQKRKWRRYLELRRMKNNKRDLDLFDSVKRVLQKANSQIAEDRD